VEAGAGGIAAAAESGEAAPCREGDAAGVSFEGDRSRADGGRAGGAGTADQPADGVGDTNGRVGAHRAG